MILRPKPRPNPTALARRAKLAAVDEDLAQRLEERTHVPEAKQLDCENDASI